MTIAQNKKSPAQKAGHINDARGRSVSQLDPLAIHLLRQYDLIDADALQSMVKEKGVSIKGGECIALIGGIGGALLMIGLFAHEMITGDVGDAPFAKSFGLLYLCSIPWIIWFLLKRQRFSHVAAAMLKHLRCPHCGYDLRMLPVDPTDGATVCPECGCAWRLGH